MAAQTLRNGTRPIARFETGGGIRYTLRSDGKILHQWRDSANHLQPARLSKRSFDKNNDTLRMVELFTRLASKMAPGVKVEVL